MLGLVLRMAMVATLQHCIDAATLSGKEIIVDAEEIANMIEGDMLLNENQRVSFEKAPNARNGLIAETKRWPDNIVVYDISEEFSAAHRAAIMEAIQTIEALTCVRFRQADESESEYVFISANEGGCYTAVGYQNRVQEMNLDIYPIGEGCFRLGTILHEFMHVLGFYHQQSSAIRDDYITVVYDNILPGKEFNFKKYSDQIVTDFDEGYDYESCLHYRSGAFSINGEDTIVPLDPKAVIGQRSRLSQKDINKINIMYKCPIQV